MKKFKQTISLVIVVLFTTNITAPSFAQDVTPEMANRLYFKDKHFKITNFGHCNIKNIESCDEVVVTIATCKGGKDDPETDCLVFREIPFEELHESHSLLNDGLMTVTSGLMTSGVALNIEKFVADQAQMSLIEDVSKERVSLIRQGASRSAVNTYGAQVGRAAFPAYRAAERTILMDAVIVATIIIFSAIIAVGSFTSAKNESLTHGFLIVTEPTNFEFKENSWRALGQSEEEAYQSMKRFYSGSTH